MYKKLFIIWAVMLLAIGLTATIMVVSCQDREKANKISLEGEGVQIPPVSEETQKSLRIVVAVLVSPKDTYGYYKELFDYLSKKLSSPIIITYRDTPNEISELIKTGEFDIALTCSMLYITCHNTGNVDLLAVARINDQTTSRSYIIVPADSSATSFEDLRNRSFCFTSYHCVSGHLVPTYILAQQGETPESFFKKYSFTGAHTDTIEAVARNFVDGGAVSSLIWEYCNHKSPEFTSKTKVIKKSAPFSNPPILVRSGMGTELKNKIREVLLEMHQDMNGKEILESLMIDKFVSVDDSAYDSIRKIKKLVDRKEKSVTGQS